MPLSTKQLIRNIPKEPDARNARYVFMASKGKLLGPAYYLFQTITRIPGDFTRKHKIWIRDLDGKDILSSNKVWVSCDCDRFQFKWEYALTKKGASSIRFSNGEPPLTTNPRQIPAGCKHIYRVLAHLAQQKRSKPAPVKPTKVK